MAKPSDWLEELHGDPLDWLLEEDAEEPGPRLFTLTDLLDRSPIEKDVLSARQAVMHGGPIPSILDAQHADGYWVEPGPGYNPKYRATVWSLISLDQLGADPEEPRVRLAGDYLLEHAIAKTGAFSMTGTPSGSIYCLNGNLIASLLTLNRIGDPRLEAAIEYMAHVTTGEGMRGPDDKGAYRGYLKSGISGPLFRCSGNNRMPCAWGGLKVMLAFSRIPRDARSPSIQQAIDEGVEFLFSRDPAQADYPMGWSEKPNRSWWKFGYPIFYVSDILQILEVLCKLGHAGDPRLDAAFQLLLEKQDENGRWAMEYTYNGKTWVDIEEKKKPSKWVTLRALRTLKARSESPH